VASTEIEAVSCRSAEFPFIDNPQFLIILGPLR